MYSTCPVCLFRSFPHTLELSKSCWVFSRHGRPQEEGGPLKRWPASCLWQVIQLIAKCVNLAGEYAEKEKEKMRRLPWHA